FRNTGSSLLRHSYLPASYVFGIRRSLDRKVCMTTGCCPTGVLTSFSSMMNPLSWLVPGPSLSWLDWLLGPASQGLGCILVVHPVFSSFPHPSYSTSQFQLRMSREPCKTCGLRR